MKVTEPTTVVVDETPAQPTKFTLSPKHKKIAKIAASVLGSAALVAVGYKLKEKAVLEAATEAATAALEAATD